MGSYWGHIDEGIFFTSMAFWWMFNAFRDYLLGESLGQEVRPRISYPIIIGKRSIPVEIVLFKILFPLAAFVGEFTEGGVRYVDSEGHFVKLVYQQHMTMYGAFFIHGVVDLMTHMKKPLYPGMNYITAMVAFGWFGVAMYTHASMHGRQPADHVVHVIFLFVALVLSIATLLEVLWQKGVWTLLVRTYCLLTIGTWFFHMANMLYVGDSFPGGKKTNLDLSAPRNVTFIKAMFGIHLMANLLVMLVCYVFTYVAVRVVYGVRIEIQPLKDSYDRLYYRPLTSDLEGYPSKLTTRKRQTMADTCIDDTYDVTFNVNSPLTDI